MNDKQLFLDIQSNDFQICISNYKNPSDEELEQLHTLRMWECFDMLELVTKFDEPEPIKNPFYRETTRVSDCPYKNWTYFRLILFRNKTIQHSWNVFKTLYLFFYNRWKWGVVISLLPLLVAIFLKK